MPFRVTNSLQIKIITLQMGENALVALGHNETLQKLIVWLLSFRRDEPPFQNSGVTENVIF